MSDELACKEGSVGRWRRGSGGPRAPPALSHWPCPHSFHSETTGSEAAVQSATEAAAPHTAATDAAATDAAAAAAAAAESAAAETARVVQISYAGGFVNRVHRPYASGVGHASVPGNFSSLAGYSSILNPPPSSATTS